MRQEDEALLLPKFDYHLDESDPDVVALRRQDGAFVAAFSAGGATGEGIGEAAGEDYVASLRRHTGPREPRGEGGARIPHRTSGVGDARKPALTGFTEDMHNPAHAVFFGNRIEVRDYPTRRDR
jgi:hypothetical protein